MTKKDYITLAQACGEIEMGLAPLLGNDDMPVYDIVELVIARIGLVCAQDNKNFDSFQFKAAAARKNARRGIKAKTGSAPRSSMRVTNRSHP
jgi:hypothetical protein